MLILPNVIMTLMAPFGQVFSRRIWDLVEVLVVGAILAPGKRTVSAVLQVMGLKDEQQFQNYHRVLNRDSWSGLAVSRILLRLLVSAFLLGDRPLVLGADETLERRWGPRIREKSIFRDSKRSGRKRTHYTPALRWVVLTQLVTVPWSGRVWALPFLTVLAPGAQTNAANGKRHKTTFDWVGQAISAVRRWLPERAIILVTDGGLSGIKLGQHCLRRRVTYITRLRPDAGLYGPSTRRGAKKGQRLPSLQQVIADPATCWTRQVVNWYGNTRREVELASGVALWATRGRNPLPIRWVLVRDPHQTLPPASFLTTDLSLDPAQLLSYFVGRWSMEVTFQEARVHLGIETQRQWSDRAIQRTTPALLGLFSFVTLLAHHLTDKAPLPKHETAWYKKPEATFSDALALVRGYLWINVKTTNSHSDMGLHIYPPPSMLLGLVESLCYST